MSIHDLNEEERRLWELAIPKTGNWQNSNCPVVRTSTIELQEAWKTAKKKGATVEKCELASQAQARDRKKRRDTGKFVEQPKQIESWLRKGRWDMEIPAENSIIETCNRLCHCGLPVHGPNFDKCTTHLGYENGKLVGILADELREYYKTHPEIKGFNREQHINFIRQRLSRIGK